MKNDPDGRLASSSAVLLAHIEFKAEMHPDQKVSRSFTRRCKAEVDTIGLFFPGVLSVEIRVCFSAWLAFACAMDDILETLPPREGEAVLYECIGILQGGRPTSGPQGA